MAETPTLWMPDYRVQWTPQQMRAHRTEIMESRSGREQRRGVYPAAGRRRYIAKSNWFVNSPDDRRSLYDFFQLMRGRLTPFYFWEPSPVTLRGFATGQTYGTSGAGDNRHAAIPLKGPKYLGDAPLSATYPATGANTFVSVANAPAIVATTMSCPPRGNTYATFLFNGFNQYADAGVAANTRIAGDQTWAAWVFLRPQDLFTNWFIAMNETASASGVGFFINSSRQPIFRTNQAGAVTTATCTTVVPLNTWTHVVAARSGTSVTFYVNGVAANTVTSINNPVTATIDLFLGTNNGGTDLFHGMMNDVRIFNTAEPAANVLAMYNDDPIFNITGVNSQAYWKMTDGKTATTFADSSANGYNATIVNPSDDRWIGGEDEVVVTANASGALVLGWVQNARQRVQARFDMDEIPESFLQSGGVYPSFDIAVREVI